MFLEFAGRPVTVAPRLGFCNRAVPALDLAIGGIEMARLDEAVLNAVLGADAVEGAANGAPGGWRMLPNGRPLPVGPGRARGMKHRLTKPALAGQRPL